MPMGKGHEQGADKTVSCYRAERTWCSHHTQRPGRHKTVLHADSLRGRRKALGGKACREQVKELHEARRGFEEVLESIFAGRKRELGINVDFDSGRRLGRELAFTHGLYIGRGRSVGL